MVMDIGESKATFDLDASFSSVSACDASMEDVITDDESTEGQSVSIGTGISGQVRSSEMSLAIFEKLEKECENERHCAPSTAGMKLPQIMELLEQAQAESEHERNLVHKPGVPESLELLELFETLENENTKHKSTIEQLRCENVKLRLDFEEIREKEKKGQDKYVKEVNRLNSEMERTKVAISSGPSEQIVLLAAQIENLQAELEVKSQQISQLNTELSSSKLAKARNRRPGTPQRSVATIIAEKEAEFHRREMKLQNQVRRLQKILYHKDSLASQHGGVEDGNENQNKENENKKVLENRILALETQLEEYMTHVREKERLTNEKHLDEVYRLKSEFDKLNATQGLDSRNTQTKAEIEHLKIELESKSKHITRLSNEVCRLKATRPRGKSSEIPAEKSNAAILAEKEADFQRKEIKLQAQIRRLQKILYHKDPNSLQPILSGRKNEFVDEDFVKDEFQEKFDEERNILEARIADLENKLKFYTTKQKMAHTSRMGEFGDMNEELLVTELRNRLKSQMSLVTCLKDELTATKGREVNLHKVQTLLEFRIRELTQEVTLAKTLSKPDSQVLADLAQTVQTLSSRYFYREKELENMISKLSMKNFINSTYPILGGVSTLGSIQPITSGLASVVDISGIRSTGVESQQLPPLQLDKEFGIYSPTTALQLLGESVDEFLINKR